MRILQYVFLLVLLTACGLNFGPAPSLESSGLCPVNPNTGRVVPTFENDVKPILEKHCNYCHNTQTPHIGEYSVLKGANTSQSIGHIETGKMPPPSAHDTLTESEINVLRDWSLGDYPIDTNHCPPPSLFLPAAPTCTLVADSLSIVSGNSVKLTLTISGKVTGGSWDDNLAISSFAAPVVRTFSPAGSHQYVVTVSGPGGSTPCSAKVTVNLPPAPTCTLTASPASITAGQASTLTLKTSGVVSKALLDTTAVAITGGTKSVSPTASRAYSASVEGPGGKNSCSAQVVVSGQVLPPAPTCTLTASTDFLPSGGGAVNLTLTAAGSFTSLSLDGLPVVTNPYVYSVNVTQTKDFVGTVTGLGGTNSCAKRIIVGQVYSGARNPKFGILVNENRCSFCHLKIIGDWYTTRPGVDYKGAFHNSIEHKMSGEVRGKIFAASVYNQMNTELDAGLLPLPVTGGIVQQYRGPEMPIDRTGDGVPDFPLLNFAHIESGVTGSVVSTVDFPVSVSKVYTGNIVLIGTQASPIKINGDVLIKGDVVIKGFYQGIGTIYSTGHIYVPSNLRAMKSAYPYPEDRMAAMALAEQNIVNGKDALGLAAKEMVHLGDAEHSFALKTMADIGAIATTPGGTYLNGWDSFKSWYPDGAIGFRKLYEHSTASYKGGLSPNYGTIEVVDAFLYGGKMVRGLADGNSYSIRGGLITEYFAVQSGARDLPENLLSPFHGRPFHWSYWEYDYRMMTGKLPILQFLMESYP